MTRDDPSAFAPPAAFGPFRVLHQIGIGALGPVFRTYEPTRDRLVAVKVFRLDVTPEQAQSLADELGRAADAGLFHPSIVEPVAAGVEGTIAYRAEEYVAAESLDVAMRHYAPATLERALPFLTQLAGAIDFARTAGVGHGALHLRDVFVTPDEARASGFGIVEALERVGVRAPVRRPYTAPERIAGGTWSTPADVFSLAAIAYELLTGRRPSGTGDQIGDLTGDNLGAHATAIRMVLARAMHDDPSRRYSTALAFASALESAAHTGKADGVVAAVPSGAATSTRPAASSVVAEAPRDSLPAAEPAPPQPAAKPIAPAAVVAPPVIPVPQVKMPAQEAKRIDKEIEEPDIVEDDDVAAERDADAAHHLLMKDVEADTAPTLFDEAEEESVADLALESEAVASDRPTRRKDERQYAPTFGSAREFDDVPPAIVERSRPAILPMTLMLILGFVLGFAIDRFMMGGFQSAPPPTQAAAEESKSTAPPAAATAGTSQPGRAYSEQTITPSQPPSPTTRSEPPPVPGDVPGSDAAVTPKPAAAASAAQTARLTIISTPTHAGVTVNGRWRGRTPLTLDTLRFGSYTVRVTQPGFSAPPEEVVLNARQPMRTLSVRLQPVNARGPSSATTPPATTQRPTTSTSPREPSSSYAGTIFVDSRPRGAKVLIDGKAMGTTPASIPDIPIGSHVVRLELADHRTWTTSTRVAAGEQTRVTGSLEPIR